MNINRAEAARVLLMEEGNADSASFRRWSGGSGGVAPAMIQGSTVISFAFLTLLAIALAALSPQAAVGQSIPTTNKGWIGLKAGTQSPPGIYVVTLLYNYNFDTLKTNDGRAIGGRGIASVNQLVPALLFSYVSEKRILGGNYSASFALPLANTAIEFPNLDFPNSWGASDMYYQPFRLGWHTKHADLLTGYSIYLPIGRFTPGSFNNTGLGQVSNEFSFGFTIYPDEKKRFHLATITQYYIESGKEDSDQRTGDSLQLQGGAGVAFRDGLINAGMAYYTQWKVTEDRVLSNIPAFRGKDRYLGFGPEFNTVLPISEKTPVFATFRYIFETGNRVATQGNTLFFSIAVAIPTKK
jgi:hypothetical protein